MSEESTDVGKKLEINDIQKAKTEIVSHPVSASGSQMVTMPNLNKNTDNQNEDPKANQGA